MPDHNPMQVLVHEHDIISKAENVIQALKNTWESDPVEYTHKVERLIAFFREYSDQFHHHKEEVVLFRELKDNPDFLPKDIVTELEGHHQAFRETVAEIEEAVDNGNYPRAQQLLEGYIDDLLDHIAIENDELFSMAESVFSAEQLERMYFQFEDIDRELGIERKQLLAGSLEFR